MVRPTRLGDRGIRSAQADLLKVGAELRDARVGAGLSLATVSRAVGMSGSQIARIERALAPTASVAQLARIGAVVGLDVRVRTFPGSDPLRDIGQIRLMERFRKRLHPGLSVRPEVPLRVVGDQRAWDAWIAAFMDSGRGMPVEAETRIVDAQSQIRRLTLKMRDASVEEVLVVISDTPANRATVAAAQGLIAGMFPVSARSALNALAAGRHPGGSALIFV